ncbi:unnamed protein product [Cladocopium goreaui]|uniref:Uncharacterized protein n=1 Tax=Cladocopium goreaui TaxID=2562237 RepID=A0A9P1DU94_9DINO|nr:unnamed protein product [Cladocopium goreaui]
MAPTPVDPAAAVKLWLKAANSGEASDKWGRVQRASWMVSWLWIGRLKQSYSSFALGLGSKAALAAYMTYRAGCRIPPLGKDPDNVMLQILHTDNPFLRLEGAPFTFLDSCRGSFLHSLMKHRGDKVTDYLVKILATPHVQRLERQRKAYMPSRVISKHGKKLRPNRDLGQLRLAGALSLCGQFLDGTLDAIFVNDSKKSWLVDPDLLLVKAELTSHICVVNACKCIHVLKQLESKGGAYGCPQNRGCSWLKQARSAVLRKGCASMVKYGLSNEEAVLAQPQSEEMHLVYSGGCIARAGRMRRIPLGARKIETAAVRFPTQRVRVKTSKRENFTSCGEATTFQGSYSGVEFRSSYELPLMSLTEKAQVLGSAASAAPPEDWTDRFGDNAVPLFWQESKPISFFNAILDEYKVTAVFDVTAGSGAFMEASLTRGVVYHGLCLNKEHQHWLQAIADRAACGLITLEGSTLFNEALAGDVKKFFPDVLENLAPKDNPEEAPMEPDSPGE